MTNKKINDVTYRLIEAEDCQKIEDLYMAQRGYKVNPIGLVKNNHPRILATVDDTIAGFAYAAPLKYNIAELYNIFVDENKRGQRIGRILNKMINNQIVEVGFSDVLFVNSPTYKGYDEGAKTFHEKNGNEDIWQSEAGTLVFYQNFGLSENVSKEQLEPSHARLCDDIYAFYDTISGSKIGAVEQIQENEKNLLKINKDIITQKGKRAQVYKTIMHAENLALLHPKASNHLEKRLFEQEYKMTKKTPSGIGFFFKNMPAQ